MSEKAEMCRGLWPLKSQPTLALAFTACSLTFLPGLEVGAANLYAASSRHFQQRFRHRAAAGVFDADEKNLLGPNSSKIEQQSVGWDALLVAPGMKSRTRNRKHPAFSASH